MNAARTIGVSVAAILASLLASAPAVLASSATSTAAVKQLVALMQQQQLETFAAENPGTAGHYVAVLLIPGAQLLLVSAEYPDPEEMRARLFYKQYRDIYAALHQPITQQSRVFIQDLGLDGLGADAASIDVMYEKGAHQTVFDGDWKRQRLSKNDYEQKLRQADDQYGRLVTVLVEALKLKTDQLPEAPADRR